jgi:hypothetical protein
MSSVDDLRDVAPERRHSPRVPGHTEGQERLAEAQWQLHLAQRKRSGLGWLVGEQLALVAQANADITAAQAEVDAARDALIAATPKVEPHAKER